VILERSRMCLMVVLRRIRHALETVAVQLEQVSLSKEHSEKLDDLRIQLGSSSSSVASMSDVIE
jgi:hypothetical protein